MVEILLFCKHIVNKNFKNLVTYQVQQNLYCISLNNANKLYQQEKCNTANLLYQKKKTKKASSGLHFVYTILTTSGELSGLISKVDNQTKQSLYCFLSPHARHLGGACGCQSHQSHRTLN